MELKAWLDFALSDQARKFHAAVLAALFVTVWALIDNGPAQSDAPVIVGAWLGAWRVYRVRNQPPHKEG